MITASGDDARVCAAPEIFMTPFDDVAQVVDDERGQQPRRASATASAGDREATRCVRADDRCGLSTSTCPKRPLNQNQNIAEC